MPEKSYDHLGLEDIVHLANKAGLEYVEARKAFDQADLLKASVKARIAHSLDNGELSESRLRRLMECSEEYQDYMKKLALLKAESEKKRVRYESYKNLFDARRSLLSYQKAEMKLV